MRISVKGNEEVLESDDCVGGDELELNPSSMRGWLWLKVNEEVMLALTSANGNKNMI